MTRHVVVVGAGQAGLALVARLRAEGFDGPITLIGAEPHPPYERPPLTKAFLLGALPRERLFLRPESFYADQGIELRLGAPVAAIDTRRQVVVMETGAELPYGELALPPAPRRAACRRRSAATSSACSPSATSATPRRSPPSSSPAAGRWWSAAATSGWRPRRWRPERGLDVTVIEVAPRILQRVAAPETADFFRALHRGHGVDIREATGLDRLEAEGGRVTGARLSTGERIAVDLVVVGVGIEPDVRLARSAGIAVENGIRTDATGRTSAPNVWAAGDCASLPHAGGRIRLESVSNAIDQAEAVARNMMGADEPYRPAPWFWSDQFDAKLQIAGLGTGHDRIVVRPEGDGVSHWYYRGGRLIAVDAINDSRAYLVGKRLIEAGISPDPSVIALPATQLKALLRA